MKTINTSLERILVRDNGLRVKINIELSKNHRGFGSSYSWSITTCEKGRRTWLPVYDADCYKFRAIPFGSKERDDFIYKKELEVVTQLELAGAATELWKKMKP